MSKADGTDLSTLARDLVERARRGGVDVAEASASEGWELSTKVRLGEPELVEEAGSRGVALRVIRDQRVAVSSTSDLTEAGIARCVADALELLELTEPDEFAGPADPSQLAKGPFTDLDLYSPEVAEIRAEEAVRRAVAAERAALAYDPRLTLSEGATFTRVSGRSVLVLSSGFEGEQRGTYASLVVTPVAEDAGGKRRRGYYWTAGRHLDALEAEAAVGEEAARRTLAKLGARKVDTCEVPVVFDPDVARGLIGTFVGCAMGSSIWRKASYLLGREQSRVASDHVTLVDDPLRPRGPGSRAFDGEGLPSRRTVVVERGMLNTYLMDCYSARKLGRTSTASASRRGGHIGPSTTNFYLEAGADSPDAIVAGVKQGLYVTEMMGFGFNAVTGDYSRGAAGFWIEDGKKSFPVSEVTVSSNLDDMLKNIDAVGNDLEFKTSTAAPTLRVSKMTIAGN
ncbi:MAG: TldD/PmbA family protein [Polyangiaceae bacterium]